MTDALFLHLTDVHFSKDGTEFARHDHKIRLKEVRQPTREILFDQTIARLAERLLAERRSLDGVIFSGDAQVGGTKGGHRLLFEMLLKHLRPVGISADNIIAVPGNHDVDRDHDPSTAERYREFTDVWKTEHCIVPWLDGIDGLDAPLRSLVAADGSWAILPINSSNWCHVGAMLPSPLAEVWDGLHTLASPEDGAEAKKIRDQLDKLANFDMARISDDQLDRLRVAVHRNVQPVQGQQVRIAVLHHHLRAPGLGEEIKPFPDIANLEQVRACMRDLRIGIAVHGHKHLGAVQYDHFENAQGVVDHRMLTLSGGTIEVGHEEDSMRLMEITGMPHCPSVRIEAVPLARGGLGTLSGRVIERQLWQDVPVAGVPIVVQGTDIDEVYARATKAASDEPGRMLVVHLEMPDEGLESLPLPRSYPLEPQLEGVQRVQWLDDLVAWWQRGRSVLEDRMPFVHGGRLRRYGGKFDQVARIVNVLRGKPSTRALAVLIDPLRDFTESGKGEQFASFCLVEFKRRDLTGNERVIDAIAFYRAQEFTRWWSINVAELCFLQREICRKLGPAYRPGRITTIAADARTQSRSPTQVSMPIIDRWLDQHPEKLHALATVLTVGSGRTALERGALVGWLQCLQELEAVTNAFNPDGVPVPVDGLEMLACFLQASGDASLDEMIDAIKRLASDNRSNEKALGDLGVFAPWASRTIGSLSELRRLTAERVSAVTE